MIMSKFDKNDFVVKNMAEVISILQITFAAQLKSTMIFFADAASSNNLANYIVFSFFENGQKGKG